MALYPKAVQRPIPPGPNDPPITPRVVILHVADTEAATLFDYFNGPSGGVESHFYIRRDGTLDQYRDTARQADANVMANDFAISIETQGKAAGEWTAAQVATIKALLLWCHQVHGIPLVKCPKWDGAGIGYHILFEDQWDQRGAACPGPDRIKQFNNVLVPWMAAGATTGDDMPLTEDDARTILTGSAVMKNPFAANPDTAPRVAASYVLEQTAARVAALAAPSAPTLTAADINAIAAKTADLIAARMKA